MKTKFSLIPKRKEEKGHLCRKDPAVPVVPMESFGTKCSPRRLWFPCTAQDESASPFNPHSTSSSDAGEDVFLLFLEHPSHPAKDRRRKNAVARIKANCRSNCRQNHAFFGQKIPELNILHS